MKNSLRLLVLPLLAATLLTTASCQTRPPDTIPASAAGQTSGQCAQRLDRPGQDVDG